MSPDLQDNPAEPQMSVWFERLMRFWVTICALVMLGDAAVQFLPQSGDWTRAISRMVLLGFAVVTHFLVFFSPKLPRRPALLLTFGAYWVVGGGFPLPLFDIEQAAEIVKGVEGGIGVAALGLLLLPGGSPDVYRLAQRPWTSAWNTLGVMLLSILLCPLLLAAWAVDGAAWGIADYSDGYMRIRPHGLVLEERRYIRGGDEVWLVGMMHIADADFYKKLFPSRGDVPPTIILLEGVTDRERKLERGFSMENVARLLGLSSQNKAAIHLGGESEMEEAASHLPDDHVIRWKNGMSVKRADIDIAEFRPETLVYLGEIGQVFGSPTLPQMLKRLFDPKSPLANEGYQKLAFEDILDKRNVHLIGEIEASFGTYDRVIVPWGALHLPEVGEWLEAEGFKETERVERVAVPFRRPGTK